MWTFLSIIFFKSVVFSWTVIMNISCSWVIPSQRHSSSYSMCRPGRPHRLCLRAALKCYALTRRDLAIRLNLYVTPFRWLCLSTYPRINLPWRKLPLVRSGDRPDLCNGLLHKCLPCLYIVSYLLERPHWICPYDVTYCKNRTRHFEVV